MDAFAQTLAMLRPEELYPLWRFIDLMAGAGSVPVSVEKEKWRNLLLAKQIAQRGEGGLRREEGYHD